MQGIENKHSSFLGFALMKALGTVRGLSQPFYLHGASGKCDMKTSPACFAAVYPDQELRTTRMGLKAVASVIH